MTGGGRGAGAARIPWRQRLLTRTVVYLVIPCVLPLLLVCLALLHYVGLDAQRHAEDALRLSVAEAARGVELYFSDLENDMRFAGTHFNHTDPKDPANALLIASFAATHEDIQAVWLQEDDRRGVVLYSRREMLSQEKTPQLAPFAAAASRKDIAWHGTALNEFGDPVVTASAPVVQPWEERPHGVLVFAVQPRRLQEIAPVAVAGTGDRAFLLAPGEVPVSAAVPRGRPGPAAPGDAVLNLLRAADPGGTETHVAVGAGGVTAYRRIAPWQWAFAVQRDMADVYRLRNRLAWLVVGCFTALIVLMLPLVVSFSVQMTRPVVALLDALRRFAAGDLTKRSDLAAGGELGLLADAFHAMAAQRLESERRYREIVDGTDNLITQVDGEGRLLFLNHVGEQVFGAGLTRLRGTNVFDFVHADDRETARRWFADCVERRIAQSSLESRLVSPRTQRVFHFLWNSHFLYDDGGRPLAVNSIAHDITARKTIEDERRKIEDRLAQSQKMESIGTLAGGIAHDFNNILAPILGYAELSLALVPESGRAADNLRAIIGAAIRARDLVQQILTFSRKVAVEKAPLLPHLVVKESLKLLRSSLPTTIEIRESIPTDCGMVLGDPTQMQQIVMNLCTNAYQAMREKGGVLSVSLRRRDFSELDERVLGLELAAGAYIELEVSDTGCGMDRETMAKIFEPYFTTKRQGEGTGLGLAIVHGIVKSSGGHVTVYSEPGRGATFHVFLPRVIAEHPHQDASASEAPLPGGTERVLVADDETVITGLLHAALTSLGYRVTTCNDGMAALRLFQERPGDFDLLVTDMTMPRLTGLELARRVLDLRPGTPVILCTGFSELISREEATAAGIREYLMKPVAVKDLALAVRRALGAG